MTSKIVLIFFLFCHGFLVHLTSADPGRDLCKIYNNGLKCSKLYSNLFPYDVFLSFNDDLAGYTNEMKFLEIEHSNISVLQSRSFQGTPYLSQLFLKKIYLTEIEQGAFEGLKKLKLVDLSYNLIRTISVDTFKYTKISRLNLEGNRLLKIPEKSPFLNAKFLTSLSLKKCNIQQTSDEIFDEVPALIHLDLSQNQLKSLPEKIFSSLKHLTVLDLSGNLFSSLSVKVFQSIPTFPRNPSSLLLQDNPWVCDCKIAQLVLWVTQNGKNKMWTNVPSATKLKKQVECSQPKNLFWHSLKLKQLMSSC